MKLYLFKIILDILIEKIWKSLLKPLICKLWGNLKKLYSKCNKLIENIKKISSLEHEVSFLKNEVALLKSNNEKKLLDLEMKINNINNKLDNLDKKIVYLKTNNEVQNDLVNRLSDKHYRVVSSSEEIEKSLQNLKAYMLPLDAQVQNLSPQIDSKDPLKVMKDRFNEITRHMLRDISSYNLRSTTDPHISGILNSLSSIIDTPKSEFLANLTYTTDMILGMRAPKHTTQNTSNVIEDKNGQDNN